ncbi:MAG: YjbH domain-containing protein [Paracoccaceae bacterium]|nr:YjbH domain-containing protein [Paracoccaceae bacterium]
MADGISSYGTPGLIDMPSATTTADGTFAFTTAAMPNEYRHTMHFQITPRLSGVFRYSILKEYFSNSIGGDLFDRSFDIHYQLRKESTNMPALAIGLRDFGGTGIYGAEYLVATKHFGERFTVTGGIGWGRLGSYGGFTNPLGVIDDRFKTRPGFSGIGETGRISLNRMFRGDAAFFGGIEYQLNDRTRLVAEYSSDAYTTEVAQMGYDHRTPFNFGIDYRATKNMTLSAFTIGGAQFGAKLSYTLDPRSPRFPGGTERPVDPILPRGDLAALGWSVADTDANRARLMTALSRQGLGLESYAQDGTRARIVIDNPHFPAAAEALGRTARAMSNTLPPEIESFEITLSSGGLPLSRTTLRRADMAELEHAWDGSWQSFVRADFADAADRLPPDAGVYPKYDWSILPYYSLGLFDPDSPLRYDLGAQFAGKYSILPGLSVSGVVRQKLVGNLDSSTRLSNSVLPHVRSDQTLYDKTSGPKLTLLTADYLFRPGRNLYGRLSAGYFEQMYAGVSGEVLWYPVESRLALGAELNYVAQRDYEGGFGLADYRVGTGHVSGYYDFGKGYVGQLDVGRYLAGDWGATVSFDREFDNGFRVGAFFTLTDVSFDDFGEGSFDKGIRISIPVDWLSSTPGKGQVAQTIRPVQRDGGARVSIANRLYGEVRAGNANELEDRWGKFWR